VRRLEHDLGDVPHGVTSPDAYLLEHFGRRSSDCWITSRIWIAKSKSARQRSRHGTEAVTRVANSPRFPGSGRSLLPAYLSPQSGTKNFDGGREVATWLGSVLKQHSSGGEAGLLGISKQGDPYRGTLLTRGARFGHLSAQPADQCLRVNRWRG